MLNIYSETSALTNQTRIKKMSSRNEYIDKLLEETKKHLQEYFQGNKEEYKKLLHQVMVQVLLYIYNIYIYNIYIYIYLLGASEINGGRCFH